MPNTPREGKKLSTPQYELNIGSRLDPEEVWERVSENWAPVKAVLLICAFWSLPRKKYIKWRKVHDNCSCYLSVKDIQTVVDRRKFHPLILAKASDQAKSRVELVSDLVRWKSVMTVCVSWRKS